MPKAKRRLPKNQLKKGFDDFAEEVGCIGKRIENRTKHDHDSLGFIGPLFKSVIGIIFLALVIWILGFVNDFLLSVFVFRLSTFIYDNISLFFTVSLLFNYSEYFSKKYRCYCFVSPIVSGIKLVFILWLLINVFIFFGGYSNAGIISSVSYFLYANLAGIFALAVFIGYIVELVGCIRGCKCCR